MKELKVRITVPGPEEDFCCQLEFDRECVRAIIERAGGVLKPEWERVRHELRLATEDTLLKWAQRALPDQVGRVRSELELASMTLENLRRHQERSG